MNFLRPDFLNIADENAAKIEWLFRLRLVASFGLLVAIPVSVNIGLISEQSIPMLIGLVLLLLGTNAVMWKIRTKVFTEYALFVQLCIDFAFFAFFIHHTSGFANPLVNLCFLHFALAGLTTSKRYCLLFFVFSSALLGFTFFNSFPVFINQSSILILFTYLVVGWAILTITYWYSKTINLYKESVTSLRNSLGKIDVLRASGLFAANICHELATPLNDALLKVDILRGYIKEQSAKVQLDEIETTIMHCGRQLQEIFSDSSLEKGQKFLVTDVTRLTIQSTRTWKSKIHSGINIEFSMPTSQIIKEIPRHLFVRTLMDFLENAKDAIGNSRGKILVTVKNSDCGKCIVAVEDSGPGFTKDIIQQVGIPFLTNKENGVGLGLYTAFHLAQYMGGNLKFAKSSLGGAMVWLEF